MEGGKDMRCAEVKEKMGKKAILAVSFGTTYIDARRLTITAIEERIKESFPDYELRRAFTSRIIIKRIIDNEGLTIDTERQALKKLHAECFEEVIVQPLHIVSGEEYYKVRHIVEDCKKEKLFSRIMLGRPMLCFSGQEERPDDYKTAIEALKTQLPSMQADEAVILVGHGGNHPANAAYAALQLRLHGENMKNVFVVTVDGEGYPTMGSVLPILRREKIKTVTLMPLMIVAGDHAHNDISGEEEDSFNTQLTAEGFTVKNYLHGLGENVAVQDLYVQRVEDAIMGRYMERSKHRPEIPLIE